MNRSNEYVANILILMVIYSFSVFNPILGNSILKNMIHTYMYSILLSYQKSLNLETSPELDFSKDLNCFYREQPGSPRALAQDRARAPATQSQVLQTSQARSNRPVNQEGRLPRRSRTGPRTPSSMGSGEVPGTSRGGAAVALRTTNPIRRLVTARLARTGAMKT